MTNNSKIKDKKVKNVIQQRKNLYNYWKDLPFSKNINNDAFFQTKESEIKSFIIKYIRDGIDDEFGKENNLSRRHAFSIREIYDAFNTQSKQKKRYSLSNFHFHFKILVQEGFLKEVEKILEGRQYQSYYGRTAITFNFFFNESVSDQVKKSIYNPIINLIKAFNPDLKNDLINKQIEKNFELLKDYFTRIILWYKTYYTECYKAKIDLQSFLDIATYFAFFQPNLYKSFENIGSFINLNKIMQFSQEEVESEYSKILKE